MIYTDKDWIALKFDHNIESMHIIIQMNGESGLRKSIRGICGLIILKYAMLI